MKYNKIVVAGNLLVVSLLGALSAMENEERKPVWVYLSDVKGKTDIKHDEWRINNNRLEVNTSADDPVSLEALDEALVAAKDGKYALLLIALRDGAGFYYMLVPSLGEVQTSLLCGLAANWVNPMTMKADDIKGTEVYFAGPDKRFYLLTRNASQKFFQNKLTKKIGEKKVGTNQEQKTQGIYEVIDQLRSTAPLGESYYYVANLFSQEADKPVVEDQQEKQERLNKKLSLQQKLQEGETEMQKLTEEVQTAEGNRFDQIFSRIPKIENEIKLLKFQIQELDKPRENTKSQLLKQYARRWYGWVPEESQKRALAQLEIEKIPDNPELFPVELQEKTIEKPIDVEEPKPIKIKHPKPIEIKNPHPKLIDVSSDASGDLKNYLQHLTHALNELALRILQ